MPEKRDYKPIPEAEWDISLTLRVPSEGMTEEEVLIAGALRIVDTQRHNIGELVEAYARDKASQLPKRTYKRAKKVADPHA